MCGGESPVLWKGHHAQKGVASPVAGLTATLPRVARDTSWKPLRAGTRIYTVLDSVAILTTSLQMTSRFETVLYQKRGPVAHLVLNRPQVINAYNLQMRDEIFQALEAVRDDPDVRVAILSGAGDRGFCAGADLTEFGTAPSQSVARRVRWERDVWGLFLKMRKPLVAALHGHVIGVGLEMACLCDIRIASQDAVFRMPEVALAMVPSAGGTQVLPRIVGPGHALDVMLSARGVKGEEALRMGLVHKLVPRDRLIDEVHRTAEALAARDPAILAAAKEAVLMGMGMDLPLDQGLHLERRLVERLLGR